MYVYIYIYYIYYILYIIYRERKREYNIYMLILYENTYVYIYIYTYLYMHANLPVNAIIRLPHPWSGDSKGQETFLAPSADKPTRNYDTECSIHQPSLSTQRSKGLSYIKMKYIQIYKYTCIYIYIYIINMHIIYIYNNVYYIIIHI